MLIKCIAGTLFLWAGTVSCAVAQGGANPEAVKHRNDCRLAIQVLTTGHPAPHYEWAYQLIGSCGPEAAPAIAKVWNQPPADVSDLNRLFYMSQKVRDKRVFDALMATVEDPGRPELVRLAALGALAAYVQPGLSLDLLRLETVSTPLFRWQSVFGLIGDSAQEEGNVPLPPSANDQIRAVIHRLAAGREYSPLRDNAWHLMRLLSADGSE